MITISSSPSTITPAYNDIMYVVTSDNKTQTNFKYVADLYVGTDVIRLKLFPNPTYGSAAFNFGRIIETYVTSDISKTTYGFQQNLNSYKQFYVQFGEEYGPSSGTTVYPNLATSSTCYGWNGILDWQAFQSYNQNVYVANTVVVGDFLTNKPHAVDIRDSEDAWLYSAVNTSGTIKDAQIITYDSAGSIIQTVVVSNPYQAITSNNDKFIRFGCGTNNLNTIASSGITTGAQPIITASVASYTVGMRRSTGAYVTHTHTFNVNNVCTQNTTYRLHFLNELGGFDSFTFIRGSNESVDIKRLNYKKVTGGLTSASTYGYSLTDRGTTTYNTSLQRGIRIKSDWIDEDTYAWLEELITSPCVYLDDPTNGLIAINVTATKYDKKQTIQDKLFNIELEFEYSYNEYRQRG